MSILYYWRLIFLMTEDCSFRIWLKIYRLFSIGIFYDIIINSFYKVSCYYRNYHNYCSKMSVQSTFFLIPLVHQKNNFAEQFEDSEAVDSERGDPRFPDAQ